MPVREGQCRCGSVKVSAKLLFCFNCFCSHCRAAYACDGGVCSTVSVAWRCGVSVTSPSPPAEFQGAAVAAADAPGGLKFHQTSSPYLPCTGVSRAVCGNCEQPVLSFGKGLFAPLTFVNHTLFKDVEPSYFFFYGSRAKDLTTGEAKECPVPAYGSDIVSILACTWIICKCVVLSLFGVDCVKTRSVIKVGNAES